jgi:hypothetical protein
MPSPSTFMSPWSEQINRNAVLWMSLDVAIETTHIGQNIMQKAVVMLDKRTLLAIINHHIHSTPLVLAFLVVGHK